jgi:hypothetical protein
VKKTTLKEAVIPDGGGGRTELRRLSTSTLAGWQTQDWQWAAFRTIHTNSDEGIPDVAMQMSWLDGAWALVLQLGLEHPETRA